MMPACNEVRSNRIPAGPPLPGPAEGRVDPEHEGQPLAGLGRTQ